MFSKASIGHVWTTIEFVNEDADGNEKKQQARFLIHPLPRREFQAKRRERHQAASAAADEAAAAISRGIAGESKAPDLIAQESIARLISHIDTKLESDEADVEMLCARTYDWRLKDEEGNDVPFSRDFLKDLLAYDAFFIPYATRFGECCAGATRKNSSPGPAGSAV
jgi:hypothetical protein